MIPDTDKAYIAGLFDGEGSQYILNVVLKRKRNTKVKVIERQIVYDYRYGDNHDR